MVDDTVSNAPEAVSPTESTDVADTAISSPEAEVNSESPETPAVSQETETKASTALGADDAPPENTDKKDDAPVADEADAKSKEVEPKKEEETQSDEPAPLPAYDSFVLPEGVTADETMIGEFTKELGEFENITKADHAEIHKFGQRLLDRHIAEVQKTAARLQEHYVNAWEKQKTEWKDAFVSDPEIGGNRQETTVKYALEFIRTHGGTSEQQKEFRDLMESTGLGNHPSIIRILANANLSMREGKPLPASKPEAQAQSKVAKRYGGNT